MNINRTKILVLVQDYPNNCGGKSLMYTHIRNIYYKKNNINIVVLNFSSDKNYEIDGIEVITLKSYKANKNNFDILICHAPNLKNHYRFLKVYKNDFKKIIFIFHGHEILRKSKEYPKPYKFKKHLFIIRLIDDLYDYIKLKVWRRYFMKVINKSEFIFVSNWIFNKFLEYVKIPKRIIINHCTVINNCVGEIFENNNYDYISEKKYDFITIRSNIDASTYCIDLLNQIAYKFSNFNFLLIGKGEYFKYEEKASNLLFINQNLSHKDLINYINQSKCALMLTRNDTQGVMSCELATYGIPLITSDISVCKEVFKYFTNVSLVNNNLDFDLENILQQLTINQNIKKCEKYFSKNTILKEIEIFERISREIEKEKS